MIINDFVDLHAYTVWANARVFTAARELGDDVWHRDLGGSFPTIGGVLSHIVSSEWVWLQRWLGESPTARPAWSERASYEELRRQLDIVEADRAALLQRITDEELDAPRTFRLLNGNIGRLTLRDQLFHGVNHTTYHRGQAAAMIRQIGGNPPSTDYVLFAGTAHPLPPE